MKTYKINDSILFNLDSMLTHAYNLRDDFRSGAISSPVHIAKFVIKDEFDAQEFINYLDDLYDKSWRRVVDAKTYSELKEIQIERQTMRYNCCLNAGMSEHDAALAYTD